MERLGLYDEFDTNVVRLKAAKTPEDKVLYLHIIDSILDDWNEGSENSAHLDATEAQKDLAWQDYGRGEQ